jgi:hypothetical protein
MGAAGLEKVRRDHSPEKHYDSLMQLYARMASAKTPRALRTSAPIARLNVAFIGFACRPCAEA